MITIFLNGPWDFDEESTKQAYEVATAAMKVKFPKAYIFNPCLFLKQYMQEGYVIKKAKLFDAIYGGKFSHIVLMNDWWLWQSARRVMDNLAEGCAMDDNDKPTIITMTDELEQLGKEYLSKLQKVEHQSKRREAEL